MDPSQLASLTPEQLAAMPAAQPPEGVQSNFDHPDSTAPRAIAVISVFLGIMIMVVALRLYSRIWVVRKTGLDDWAALAGAICTTGLAGTALYQLSQNWFGPHMWDIHLTVFLSPVYNRLIFVLTIMLMPASFFVKVSVLLFIYQIFPRRASPKTAYAVWAGLAMNLVAYSALIIYIGVSCAPRPADNGMLPAQCTAKVRQDQGVVSAVINAAMDLYVLAIAIPAIWTLQMATRRKIGITGVLGVGIIACAFSFVTLYYRVGTDGADDPSRNQTVPLIFTVLEPTFGMITACLPTIPALWVEVSARAGSSIRGLLSRIRTRGSTSRLDSGNHSSSKYSNSKYSKSGYEMHSRSADRSNVSSQNRSHVNDMFMTDIEQTPIVPYAFTRDSHQSSER
ncbi:hypothetical protein BKA67DRAFT_643441 [Truncatella angustata]|uniref:Rhodopsin domain-containing protein n=1 Tax=Truncatella angustata TaxID=152316 RepID=A0A9P8ZZN2_9PEZI|nr:uncharacterized protein BKA67DRAFT_643441 [Truncatella angustata]KAH6657437.1 hypothetical protein BKA67DRAFT_643441 [Truncatella angustata]